MNRKTAILCVFLAVLCSPACLQQQTGHTLYLSPDGAVTWTAIERDVRSDAPKAEERAREEQEFLNRLSADRHPILTGLRFLGASDARTVLLREERPYIALTEGRFDRADRLLQNLLEELRVSGSASLTRNGEDTTLTIAFEVPREEPESSDESPITPLIDFDEPYRFVLTAGRFVAASGFTLESDDTVAAIDERWMKERCEPGSTLTLSLTWTTANPKSQNLN